MFYLLLCGFFFLRGDYAVFNQLLLGLFLLYIAVSSLRLIHFKERPKHQAYGNIFEKIDAGSFPSMHASRTTFLFFVLRSYFDNTLITPVLALLVLLTCYSRLYFEKHDLSDLVAGVFVGGLIGLFVLLF